jgi:peptide-methionine (R)-S-oxide reductase
MQRRQFLFQTGALVGTYLIAGPGVLAHPINKELDLTPLDKSEKEWRNVISKQEYHILFEEGTERPNSSPLNRIKEKGTFICAACYLPLFESETKYDSGTGWPSFYQPIEGRVDTKIDLKLVWPRTEYHCVRCGGHQGHVFDDGPEPTGLRYCNNGLALKFIPADKPLPELRS